MPAKKKSAKKTPAKKKAAKKAPAKKKTTKKKASSGKKAAGKAATKAPEAKKAAPPKKGFSASQVVLGHLFALRPRVVTAFKPDDFRRAKQLLEDESYSSVQEAARAVAEKALELTGEGRPKRP